MGWHPLAGARRAELELVIRDIAAAIDRIPAVTVRDQLSRGLLRAYLAEGDVVPDPDDVTGASLAHAIAAAAHGPVGLSLFDGISGIGWTVSHLAGGDEANLVCARFDALLTRQLESWSGDYDLLGGLVGFGVYALERGEPGRPLATRVLDELERRARPRAGGLAWHTAPELLPAFQRETAPRGYWNLGLAHGAAGVIALLARYVAAGIDVPRVRPLLDAAVAAQLAAEPVPGGGHYPVWQLGGPDDQTRLADDRTAGRGRLAWCYNDLGIALALAGAAAATEHQKWRDTAHALAAACASRSIEVGGVIDTGLCHGACGSAHLFDRFAQATGDDVFATAARTWLDQTLAMRTDQPPAGFPSRADSAEVSWAADTSVLTGAAGVALVLHSMITDVEPAWDRLLLAELPTSVG